MQTYIILLRGINVSGKHKILMADLRKLLEKTGFKNATTYIQSGNIILNSELKKSIICKQIKNAIFNEFGYGIQVLGSTLLEWKKVIKANPFLDKKDEKLINFTFLDGIRKVVDFDLNVDETDEFFIKKNVVYLCCLKGYGNTKFSNNLFEKKLKVNATTRNYRTTLKLLDLAKEKNKEIL